MRRCKVFFSGDRETTSQIEGPDTQLLIHARLNGLANRFQIPALGRMSRAYFAHLVGEADSYDDVSADDVLDLCQAIEIVYGTRQKSDILLKEATVYISKHVMEQSTESGDDHRNCFEKHITSFKDFATDLASFTFTQARFKCEFCNEEHDKDEADCWKYCSCTDRGICGYCHDPILTQQCPECGKRGGLTLIEREPSSGASSSVKRKRSASKRDDLKRQKLVEIDPNLHEPREFMSIGGEQLVGTAKPSTGKSKGLAGRAG